MNIRKQFTTALDPEIKEMCRVLRLSLAPDIPIATIEGIYKVLVHLCVIGGLGLSHPDLDALFKDVERIICKSVTGR